MPIVVLTVWWLLGGGDVRVLMGNGEKTQQRHKLKDKTLSTFSLLKVLLRGKRHTSYKLVDNICSSHIQQRWEYNFHNSTT